MTTLIADLAEETPPDDVGAIVLASVAELPAVYRRLLRLLSVAVTCTAGELERAHGAIWPLESLSLAELESFLGLALVERVGDRYRVLPPADIRAAREWRDSDTDEFNRAHQEFVEIERNRQSESGLDDYEAWQVKARLAYYLSSASSSESLTQYSEAFDSPPQASRLACRLWLATLAERFSEISGMQSRVTRFFGAFRTYVAGDRTASGPVFRSLVGEEKADEVAAISSHLLALCLDRHDRNERLSLLRSSVALSNDLKLSDNLLMSRNTLAWSLVAAARQGVGAGLLAEAMELVRDNDRLADNLGIASYQTATRYARAIVSWYAEVGTRATTSDAVAHGPQADRSLSLLQQSRAFAEASSDLGAWVNSAIGSAQIYRDLGDPASALRELEAAVSALQAARELGEIPVRQFHDELDRLVVRFPSTEDEAQVLRAAFVRVLRRRVR